MTDPAVRIISLTVTEKGYCHDPATGDSTPDHPDIAARPRRTRASRAPRRASSLRPCAVAARGVRALHGPVLRQPSRERPHVGRVLAHFARCATPTSAAGSRRSRVPLDHGRPHRPGDQRRRPRRDRDASASRMPGR